MRQYVSWRITPRIRLMWNNLEECAKPATAMHLRGNLMHRGAMVADG